MQSPLASLMMKVKGTESSEWTLQITTPRITLTSQSKNLWSDFSNYLFRVDSIDEIREGSACEIYRASVRRVVLTALVRAELLAGV